MTEYIVTILNIKTKECRFIYCKYPKQIDEIFLDEDETMYVNEIKLMNMD